MERGASGNAVPAINRALLLSVKARILTDFCQRRSNGRLVEKVMAQLRFASHQYRYFFTVTFFQPRIGININNMQCKTKTALQQLQSRDHVIAQMAIRASVQR